MTKNLAVFAVAASCEIAGCFLFWLWLRERRAAWLAVAGIGFLIAFAVALTRVDAPFAGRAYAAYGGIYIAASLAWLWIVERQRPSPADLAGAALCLIGAAVIIGFAVRRAG